MTTYNVSNSTQLQSALSQAHGGDTVVLAAGNYGSTWITNRNYSSAVTIKSATPRGAHLDYLLVSGSSNMRFEGLDVGRALKAGESNNMYHARVSSSDGIKMVGMSFHGSLDNNPANDGIGLHVSGSSNFQLIGSSFKDLYRGAYIQEDTNVTVASNSFQMIRTDGLNVGAVTGITIDKNNFTNFHPSKGDHADAIQFWLTGQSHGSSNISVTNNVIMQGTGVGMQGIFMSDPTKFDYKNVLIQNNLVYSNDQYHGIYLNGVHGAQVIGNTLLSKSNDSKMLWIDLVNGSNITVKDNLADQILVQRGATHVTLADNANLAQMAWLRGHIPHLNAPTSAKDLIVHDYGYQSPGSINPGAAPVSVAVANGIDGTPSAAATSAQISAHPIAQAATVHPVSNQPGALPAIADVFPTHVDAPAVHAPTLPMFGNGGMLPHFDHFAALG